MSQKQRHTPTQSPSLTMMMEPVGGHYMIGEQISYSPGWRVGAMHSAFHAIDIDRRGRERAVKKQAG